MGLVAIISLKKGGFLDLQLEPDEMEGYASCLFFFFHLGLSEKHIIFEIGDTFFSTVRNPLEIGLFV